MIKATVIILFLIPVFVFGQINNNYHQFVPKGVSVKPLLDTDNFIDDNMRLVILDYFKLTKLDPSLYFIDSLTQQKGDTMSIYFWDITGLKKVKQVEDRTYPSSIIADSLIKKKLRIISINGEPGNGFSILFDRRKNMVISKFFQQ